MLEYFAVAVYSLSHVVFFETPWTVAHQASLSMGFPRQEARGLPFPSPRDLPDPRIKLARPVSPAWQMDSSPLSHLESPKFTPTEERKISFPD